MKETMDDRPHAEQDPPSTTESCSDGCKGLGPITGILLVLLTLAIVTLAFLSWRRALSRADRSLVAPGPLPSTDEAQAPLPSVPQPAAPDPPPPKTAADLIEEAKRFADGVVESFPNDPDAIEVKARVQYYLGSYPAAVECWERCIERDPTYAYAYHGLGLVAAKKADYEEAAAKQRQALTLAGGFSDAAVELADALMKLAKLDEAIEVLEKHLKVDPRSAPARVSLGHAYLQAREYQKAREAYRAALEIHADIPRAQFGLATALARLGQPDESRQAMEKYKELEANKLEVRTNLRSRFDDLGAMCVDFAVSFTYASRVCLAHGDLAEAERLCRRAATLDPNNTQCRIQLASLYQQTNRGEEALRVCRQLTEIEPENLGYHLNLGIMYGNLGRFQDAEEALREVIRLAPESAEGSVALARLYLRTGRKLAEATRLAQEAVRTSPNAPSYALLSQAHAANREHAEAISAIEKAIELDSANPHYREMLELFQQGK